MRKESEIREKFTEALLDIVEKKSITKVTVQEICKQSNLSTRTFYNYYKDKNDLVSYVWSSIHRSIFSLADYDIINLKEYFSRSRQLSERNRRFYLNTLGAYYGQNSLWETIFNTAVEGIVHRIKKNGHEDKLNTQMMAIIRFYAHGLIGLAKEYIEIQRSSQSLELLYQFVDEYEMLPEKLKQIL